jgi:hypothetical protein
MAKLMTDGMIDGGLTKYGTGVKLTVCAGQPTSFADIAARALGATALVGGDFTIANGNVSGRKSTIAAKSGILVDTSGTADHVVVDDGVSEYAVTTCTAQALIANGSNTFATPAFDREIGDPT